MCSSQTRDQDENSKYWQEKRQGRRSQEYCPRCHYPRDAVEWATPGLMAQMPHFLTNITGNSNGFESSEVHGLMVAHVVLPTDYPPAYLELVSVWFVFDGLKRNGSSSHLTFVWVPPFLIRGLPRVIPLLLFGLLLLQHGTQSSKADFLFFALSAVLSIGYHHGWVNLHLAESVPTSPTAAILPFTLSSSRGIHFRIQTKGRIKFRWSHLGCAI